MGFKTKLEENTYVYEEKIKSLEKSQALCLNMKHREEKPTLIKTYLSIVRIEFNIKTHIPLEVSNAFSQMFDSRILRQRSMICDNLIPNGRQIVFISGDRKYSLDFTFYD